MIEKCEPIERALQELRSLDFPTNVAGGPRNEWPTEKLAACRDVDVFKWFVAEQWGGFGLSQRDIVTGYVQLAQFCLTTTFIITQRTAATRRVESSQNEALKEKWLPRFANAYANCTVGISHLTTSRQHVDPVAKGASTDAGFVLNGFTPWVTGSPFVDVIVAGFELDDQRQVLALIETEQDGVSIEEPVELVALSGSCTGKVKFKNVEISTENVIAGPIENVMSGGSGGGSGGLQTSALAIGLAGSAIEYIEHQSQNRSGLQGTIKPLREQWDQSYQRILEFCDNPQSGGADQIRQNANSLVLRATQTAMGVAKGAGYVAGHPVGRWCREALFFLVWSCPAPVLESNLCELVSFSEQ